ncbi:MAG: fatty acid metabolism transcriptional regulator FadR [Anaerolineaceae bacterium]|nr:fatty acid metabolism transcriptional regulator FadR [Anaerolineaceae bacterium]
MKQWVAPKKPAEFAEYELIESILIGDFPIDSTLPGERELSELLGVTRPTLREVLQRMGRDGWIDIQQGKATRVRNYLVEGNLGVLSSIVEHKDHVSPEFTGNLLTLRFLVAPAYTKMAIANHPDGVLQALNGWEQLSEEPDIYSVFDWNVHHRLSVLSGNPVFPLMLNGFKAVYHLMGKLYFSSDGAYQLSNYFYRSIVQAARLNDPNAAEHVCTEVMKKSEMIWRKIFETEDEE